MSEGPETPTQATGAGRSPSGEPAPATLVPPTGWHFLHLFYRIEQDPEGSAAIAVVLLVISFAVLLGIGGLRWLVTRHERG